MEPLPRGTHSSPVASGPRDCSLHCSHRTKRARVENIIRGMTSSPGRHFTDVIAEKSQHEELDKVQENKIKRCSSHYNDHTQRSGASGAAGDTSPNNQHRRKQLQVERPLGHLRAEFTQEYGGNESQREVSVEENRSTCNDSSETSPGETFTDPHVKFERPSDRKYQGWKKMKLMSYIQSKPDRVNRLMADILKYELSRAVNMSVDSIFQNIPPLQRLPHEDGGVQTDNKPLLNLQEQSSFCKDSESSRLSWSESTAVHIPEVQTEALSLVVEKPPQARSSTFNLLPVKNSQDLPQPPLPFAHGMALHEDQPLENVQNSPLHNALRGFQDGYPRTSQPRLETFDLPWNSVKVKVRSKVNSRSVRGPQVHPMAMDPMLLESLCLPHVKKESDVLQNTVTNNTYVLNEGLTSNHLNKAKLMFFFTRYPSSTVLRTYFGDVQFTRCITSQLIKWFSNFREFYYIQMEKYARHAVVEGVAGARDLSVGRESELFRALNIHYNKANDFQVPDSFLEVAEITLREFYMALSMGKDSDPSWKKAIYKVISKLDSDVPVDFKSHSFT